VIKPDFAEASLDANFGLEHPSSGDTTNDLPLGAAQPDKAAGELVNGADRIGIPIAIPADHVPRPIPQLLQS